MKDNMGFVWWRILPIIYVLTWLEDWKPSAWMEILLFSFIFIIPLIIQLLAPKDASLDTRQKTILFLDSIIETGILLLVSLIPWVIGQRANDIDFIKIVYCEAIAFTTFFAWTLKCIIIGKFELIKTKINIPILVFFIWCIVTFITSPYKYASLKELYRFTSYVFLFFVIVNNLTTWVQIRRILITLLITAGLTAVYGYFQAFGLDFISWQSRPMIPSSLGCPYEFSDFLLLVIPLVIGILISLNDSRKKIIFFLFVVSLLAALYLTRVVLSVVSLGAGLSFFTVLKLKEIGFKNPAKLRLSLLIVMLIICAITGIIGFGPAKTEGPVRQQVSRDELHIYPKMLSTKSYVREYYRQQIVRMGTTLKESVKIIYHPYAYSYRTKDPDILSVQITMWHTAYKMFLDHPVFGVGLGAFQQVFPEYRPSYYRFNSLSHNTLHSSNEFLEILSEMGVPGLVLFLWIIITFIKTGIKKLVSSSEFKQNLILGCMAGVLACLLSSIKAGCPSLRYHLAPLFWSMMGMCTAIAYMPENEETPLQETKEEEAEKKVQGNILIILWAIFFVFAGFFLIKQTTAYYLADIHLRKGNLCRDVPEGWDKAMSEYKKAMKYEPTNIEVPYKLAYIYAQKKEWQKALDCYLGISRLAPNYTQIHYNLGITYYNLGIIEKACPEFKKTTDFDNSNDVAYLMLGVCYVSQEQWEKALDAFKNAVESRKQCALIWEGENPNYPAANLNIGNIYYRLGRLDEAKKEYRIVLKSEPKNKDALARLKWIEEGKAINWE